MECRKEDAQPPFGIPSTHKHEAHVHMAGPFSNWANFLAGDESRFRPHAVWVRKCQTKAEKKRGLAWSEADYWRLLGICVACNLYFPLCVRHCGHKWQPWSPAGGSSTFRTVCPTAVGLQNVSETQFVNVAPNFSRRSAFTTCEPRKKNSKR